MPMATDAWIQPNSEKLFVLLYQSQFSYEGFHIWTMAILYQVIFFCKSMTDKSRVPYFEA